MNDSHRKEFERAAGESRGSLLRELVDLLRENKKWWLVPLLAMLLLMGVLVALSGTPGAPFIYTLF
ncbi:MAG: hypothetical protein DMD99_20490 [Candidatus Rokuibacteriota bacterium]|nr:MAG: hypothetical protein DMD99_20490 [Candidatus Rokubacteria bacterium]